MKYIKIGLASITIVFAILGLTELLDFYITAPIMVTSLAAINIINAQACYKSSKRK
ncbi:MAG: hypothetical protein RR645_03420 [Clostridium sp.]